MKRKEKTIVEFSSAEIELMKKLANSGIYISEIAEKLNRPYTSVRNKLISLKQSFKKRKYVKKKQ